MEITDAEQKREKRLKTNEESLRELWDNVKHTNIHIIGVPEREEREKGKTPENQLSDEEILSLQEEDFRLLMLKMMQDIGNKLEAKMDNLQETLAGS